MAASLSKSSVARNKINVVSEDLGGVPYVKQIATGAGHELIYAKLLAGGSAAVARIVDTANIAGDMAGGGYSLENGIAMSAEASGADHIVSNRPIPFRKGIAVVFEQGQGANAECFILFD